jgi:hypothetical protein
VSFAGNRSVRPNGRFGELFLGRSVAFKPGIGYLKPAAERHLKFFSGGTCADYA